MSYLNLSKGIPNFTQVVISFWFRVPQASITKAAAAFTGDDAIGGILPLVVLGKPGLLPAPINVITEEIPHPGSGITTKVRNVYPSGEPVTPSAPTVIGLDCSGGGKPALLYVNFETNQVPAASACRFNISTGNSYTDVSSLVFSETGAIYSDQIATTPDKWHHVLVSLDLKTIQVHGIAHDADFNINISTYVDSAARLFVALDDVNYAGSNLNARNCPFGSADLNAIVTRDAISVAGSGQTVDIFTGTPVGPIPQYTIATPSIPSSGQAMGLPGTADIVNNIYRVELAEFQMWTGVVLDTGVISNRRAFVDVEGKPVKPAGKKDDPQAPAEKLLGKKPDILLHGSGNWKDGYNTGTIGIIIETIDGKETVTKLPDGQFHPVAGIEAYKPDPSL